ncbi:MAG: hypothetical protein HDR88_14010 [Bacteroides sp.]|nr:hypothetical protein [Bacteroides sp.]
MADFHHSFNRRCKGHDYRSRCIYIITMLKSPAAPLFSSITPDPASKKILPIVTLHPVGNLIYKCLDKLCIDHPQLRILRRIAMPDHLHFELFVTERTKMALGSLIASFKSGCTCGYWSLFPESQLAKEKLSLFEEGFNDKIAFRAGAKDAFYNYIADNPRRYLVKKLCSEYFFHKLKIVINGISCGLYGNIFLLDNPVKSFVKISRVRSQTPNLDSKLKDWEETIRCGGVLVSPFINPEEKHFRHQAIANGNSIIIIVDYRLSERTKPYKTLFDLCTDGRLLIISTEEYATPPRTMHYEQAHKLNAIAAAIALLPPRGAKILPC